MNATDLTLPDLTDERVAEIERDLFARIGADRRDDVLQLLLVRLQHLIARVAPIVSQSGGTAGTVIALVGALWFYFKLDWDLLHVPFVGNFNIGKSLFVQ